jgi:hypothetical protein
MRAALSVVPALNLDAHFINQGSGLQGAHKVTVRLEEGERPAPYQLVRLAEESNGRYLLLYNLPLRCTRSDIQQMFKGSKLLDYSLDNSTSTYVATDSEAFFFAFTNSRSGECAVDHTAIQRVLMQDSYARIYPPSFLFTNVWEGSVSWGQGSQGQQAALW